MSKTILTFEAACAAKNQDPNLLPDVSMLPEAQQKYLIGLVKLDVITRALNDEGLDEPWQPDYEDYNSKYCPVFDFSPGSGWSYGVYVHWHAYSHVGARPFRSYQLAEFAGEQFADIYNNILNYTNNITA